MEALLKFKRNEEDRALTLGKLTDNPPFFYIFSDLGDEILYTELRAIQQDVEIISKNNEFDLDNYIKFYTNKLYFEKGE